MPLPQRKPYDGFQRKLIIAFDIGTTFSGVSYAFLIPDKTPVIQGVARFPGQTGVGDSKIPSAVCYDRYGNVVAVGSETDVETNPELREIQGLVRAEWFKLHLQPAHLVAEQGFDDRDIPALPRNKSVIDIFSDLLRYTYKSTNQYIRERHGDDMLRSVGNNIEFILSHPNCWECLQLSEMRPAAINADLVNANEAPERISFVTEGEASLHFCLNKCPDTFGKYTSDGILVADCGGGTVDISSYARSESMTSGSLFQGSFFVTRRAQTFLTEKLRRSTFGTKRYIEYFIRFGRNENDPEHDIRSGNIKLSGIDIAKFFEPTIKNIIKAIDEQTRMTATRIRAIFMVGRFSTSDYLFSKLEDHFKSRGIDILRLETYINKTVAEGAMIFKIESFMSSEPQRRLTKNDFDLLQKEYNRELRAAQDELQALREQRDALKKLVDTQAVELTAAREFTFITDQVSATDVSRTIQELNSAIYQTAVQLISIEQPAPPTALPAPAADTERLQVQARIYSVSVIGE
ncbi:hypothetical protein F5887DRAFT_1286174 [Amanita rubescens]|nr:hypothetical protein F5887DRAFT_1286174 [Amanita rubescens]